MILASGLSLQAQANSLCYVFLGQLVLMASGRITSWQIDGETVETVVTLFFWAPKSLQMVTAAMKLEDACSLERKLWPT